jgi:hypothetical protein
MADANDGDADASQNGNQGVANQNQGVKTPPKRDPVLTARDEMLARLDEQIIESRSADDETFFQTADPRALAMAVEMGRESRGEQISSDSRQGRQQAAREEVAPVTQEAEPEPTAKRRTQVDEQGRDPLEDFIVREDGRAPMFKTIVNGQVRLVPLETARTQLQKHLSAEVFFNKRKGELDAREQALNTRAAQPVMQPADDASIDTDATDLVRSLLSDPEAVAAKKMAATLRKIRQGATPQIDINAVGQLAANVARREIAAEDTQKALTSGLSKFQSTYPEISEGSELYLIADRKTEAIAEEHPEWSPEQVMLEAGKQTRDWVKSLGQVAGKRTGVVQLSDTRQQLKQNLKPMPQSRSARPAPAQDDNADQSPQDAMAEIRKSRGQAY